MDGTVLMLSVGACLCHLVPFGLDAHVMYYEFIRTKLSTCTCLWHQRPAAFQDPAAHLKPPCGARTLLDIR